MHGSSISSKLVFMDNTKTTNKSPKLQPLNNAHVHYAKALIGFKNDDGSHLTTLIETLRLAAIIDGDIDLETSMGYIVKLVNKYDPKGNWKLFRQELGL